MISTIPIGSDKFLYTIISNISLFIIKCQIWMKILIQFTFHLLINRFYTFGLIHWGLTSKSIFNAQQQLSRSHVQTCICLLLWKLNPYFLNCTRINSIYTRRIPFSWASWRPTATWMGSASGSPSLEHSYWPSWPGTWYKCRIAGCLWHDSISRWLK